MKTCSCGQFEPRYGDSYYVIGRYGAIESAIWGDSEPDKERLYVGNCYPSISDAIKALNKEALEVGLVAKLKVLKRIDDYIVKNNMQFSPKWTDTDQVKISICYDHECKVFSTREARGLEVAGMFPYFSSIKDAMRCVGDCKTDWKILFGVKS